VGARRGAGQFTGGLPIWRTLGGSSGGPHRVTDGNRRANARSIRDSCLRYLTASEGKILAGCMLMRGAIGAGVRGYGRVSIAGAAWRGVPGVVGWVGVQAGKWAALGGQSTIDAAGGVMGGKLPTGSP